MSPVKGRKSLSKGDSAPSMRNVAKNIPLAAVQSLNKSPKEETPKTRKLLSTPNTPCPSSDKPQKRKRSKGERCGTPPESPGNKKLIVELADASAEAVPKSPPTKSEQNSKANTPCAKKGDKKLKFSRASKQKNSKGVRKNVGNEKAETHEVLKAGEKVPDEDETVELEAMTRTSNVDKQETKTTTKKTILDIRDEDDESDEDFEVTSQQLEEESEDLEEEYDDTDEGDFGNDERGDNESSPLKTALNILSVDLNSDDDDDEEWSEALHLTLRCEDEVEEEESPEEDGDEEEEVEEEEESGEEVDEDGSSGTVDLEDEFDDTILLASSPGEEEPDKQASADECEEDDEEIPQLVAAAGEADAGTGREALPGRKSVLIKNLPHNVTLAEVKEFIGTHLPMVVVSKYKLLPKGRAVIDFVSGTHKHALLLNGRKYKSRQLLAQLLPPQGGGAKAKGASRRGSKWQVRPGGGPAKLAPAPVKFEPSEAPSMVVDEDSDEQASSGGSPSEGRESNGRMNGKRKGRKSESPERAEEPEAAAVPPRDLSARSQLRLVVCGLPTEMPAEKVERKLCGLLGTAGRVRSVQVLAGVPGSFHVSIATMEDLHGFRSALRLKDPCVGEHGVDISSGRLAAPLLQMLAEQRASRVQGASRSLQSAQGGPVRALGKKQKKNKKRSSETAV